MHNQVINTDHHIEEDNLSTTIALREITRDNWRECAKLKVAPDQQRFVAPNSWSLLQCLYQDPTNTFAPFGIYDGDTMVGFVMYGMTEYGDGLTGWEIWRLMVDEHHQHKGYGRAALREIIVLMRERLACEEIIIMFERDNSAAQRLYESVGFVDTGIMEDNEKVYRLDVSANGRPAAV